MKEDTTKTEDTIKNSQDIETAQVVAPEESKSKHVHKVEPKTELKHEPKSEVGKSEVPAKFKKIVEEIENMSVLDLNELVKVFENKFGVSATAVAVVGAVSNEDSTSEEKTMATVELIDGGANKIAVIKVVKEVLGLGLKEAKDLVDAVPSQLGAEMKKEEAETFKKKIEEAGGKVTLK
jgi:large subunit ribosomal protein L7/L12